MMNKKYIEIELSDDKIKQYVKGGFIVEEINDSETSNLSKYNPGGSTDGNPPVDDINFPLLKLYGITEFGGLTEDEYNEKKYTQEYLDHLYNLDFTSNKFESDDITDNMYSDPKTGGVLKCPEGYSPYKGECLPNEKAKQLYESESARYWDQYDKKIDAKRQKQNIELQRNIRENTRKVRATQLVKFAKDDSKKYSLIKPIKIKTDNFNSSVLFEDEYNDYINYQIKNAMNQEGLLPDQIQQLNVLAKDPKQFAMKVLGIYPVKDAETGVYQMYDAKKIQEKIYNHGMSARKISEDLGIGVKGDIQNDFALTFENWKADYDLLNKKKLMELYRAGYSREEAIQDLLGRGMIGSVDDGNRVFDEPLDAIEARSETLKWSNMTMEDQAKYVDDLMKNGVTENNEDLSSWQNQLIEKRKEDEVRLAAAAEEFKEKQKLYEQYGDHWQGQKYIELLEKTSKSLKNAPLTKKEQEAEFKIKSDWVKEAVYDSILSDISRYNRTYFKHGQTSYIGMHGEKRYRIDNPTEEADRRLNNLIKEGSYNFNDKDFVNGFIEGEGSAAAEKWCEKQNNWCAWSTLSPGKTRAMDFSNHLTQNAEWHKLETQNQQAKDDLAVLTDPNVGFDPDVVIGGVSVADKIKELEGIIEQTDEEMEYFGQPVFTARKSTGPKSSDDKFKGEASFWEKLMNPVASIQYAFDGRTMPSNYAQYKDLLDKEAAIYGSNYIYDTDRSVYRADNNNVMNVVDFASSVTPVGMAYQGLRSGYNMFRDEGSLDKFIADPSKTTALGLGVDALGLGFGSSTARGLLKKGVNAWAPDVTGTIGGLSDDILRNKKAQDGWLNRVEQSIYNNAQKTFLTRNLYNPIRALGKDIIEMDTITGIPGINLISDVKTVTGLGRDAYKSKIGQGLITGYGLTYVPSTLGDLKENISEGNYSDAALNVGELGLNLLPGFAFKNFKSTIGAPVDLIRKGVKGEVKYTVDAINKLRKGYDGNLLQKGIGYGTDLSKGLYHGSVLATSPWALGSTYNLLTDKDATASEQWENASKALSILPGVPGFSNAKYIGMGGTQIASDPDDPTNVLFGTLEASGVGRYGKFGNYGGKLYAKGDEFFGNDDEVRAGSSLELETNDKSTIPTTSEITEDNEKTIEEVGDNVDEIEETEDLNQDNKKQPKYKKQRKRRLFKNKKIEDYQQGGLAQEVIEIEIEPEDIQKYLLGGYIIEEI